MMDARQEVLKRLSFAVKKTRKMKEMKKMKGAMGQQGIIEQQDRWHPQQRHNQLDALAAAQPLQLNMHRSTTQSTVAALAEDERQVQQGRRRHILIGCFCCCCCVVHVQSCG